MRAEVVELLEQGAEMRLPGLDETGATGRSDALELVLEERLGRLAYLVRLVHPLERQRLQVEMLELKGGRVRRVVGYHAVHGGEARIGLLDGRRLDSLRLLLRLLLLLLPTAC